MKLAGKYNYYLNIIDVLQRGGEAGRHGGVEPGSGSI
jgi:hypothetical protein